MSLYASEVEYKKHIGKVDYAYNSTLGRAHDMLEAYIQLDREAPDFFDSLRGFFDEFVSGGVINKIDDEIAAAKVDEALVRAVEERDLSSLRLENMKILLRSQEKYWLSRSSSPLV